MRIVVAYDVSDRDRRTLLARHLGRIGVRVQESVFECLVDDEEFDDLVAGLHLDVDPTSDVIHVFRLCDRCEERSIRHGNLRFDPLDALYWLV